MKIAIISTILHHGWGGADVLWTCAAELLLHEKHQLLLAVSPQVSAHPRIVGLNKAGAQLHIRHGFTWQRGRRQLLTQKVSRLLRSPRSLMAALDRFQPDFVIINQGGAFDLLVEDGLRDWLHAARRPFALICQSNDDAITLDPDAQQTTRTIFSQASKVFFVSTQNRDAVFRQTGTDQFAASIVHNPVELPSNLPLPWPSASAPQMAVVARLEMKQKGLDLLLDALAACPRDRDWRVNIFGQGPDREMLQARAVELSLASRVSFSGHEKDITEVWRRHHCLLLPSRHEGCSLAMLEAMSCGRPVIANNVGGVLDWITPEFNGYICLKNDVASLSAVISYALNGFAAWEEYGRNASHRITHQHDRFPEKTMLSRLNIC